MIKKESKKFEILSQWVQGRLSGLLATYCKVHQQYYYKLTEDYEGNRKWALGKASKCSDLLLFESSQYSGACSKILLTFLHHSEYQEDQKYS